MRTAKPGVIPVFICSCRIKNVTEFSSWPPYTHSTYPVDRIRLCKAAGRLWLPSCSSPSFPLLSSHVSSMYGRKTKMAVGLSFNQNRSCVVHSCPQLWLILLFTSPPSVLSLIRTTHHDVSMFVLCVCRGATTQVTRWWWTRWSMTSTCCPAECSTRRPSPSSVWDNPLFLSFWKTLQGGGKINGPDKITGLWPLSVCKPEQTESVFLLWLLYTDCPVY